MQTTLKLKVKFRESFRPFAPAILAEDVATWFNLNKPSPYMLLVADVADDKKLTPEKETENLFGIDRLKVQRSVIPAVTHVDYSARVQTVHQETNPKFHALISEFKAQTHCPVLVNTSFNVRGEPIVCTPTDAFRCFMGTKIERLVIGNYYLQKENQPSHLQLDYKDQFELD
jgi:carbamoyltransferase